MPAEALAVRVEVTALALAHAEARFLTAPSFTTWQQYLDASSRHHAAETEAQVTTCVVDLYEPCPVHHVAHHEHVVTVDTPDLWFA